MSAEDRTFTLRVRRWGDRLALLLPPEVVAQEGILPEDVLVVRVRKRRFAFSPESRTRRP